MFRQSKLLKNTTLFFVFLNFCLTLLGAYCTVAQDVIKKIDLEALYKRMFLLKKKKFAAVVTRLIEGQPFTVA